MQIGIDIGGTFTDIVALDEKGRLSLTKVPSTPRIFSKASPPPSPGCCPLLAADPPRSSASSVPGAGAAAGGGNGRAENGSSVNQLGLHAAYARPGRSASCES